MTVAAYTSRIRDQELGYDIISDPYRAHKVRITSMWQGYSPSVADPQTLLAKYVELM
jgi:hypothetical protein